MKAITFRDVQQVACETVPDPVIQSEQDAIVKVDLAGLCGSDLHVYHGREKGLDAGTVMGHELVGEVVEKGKSVNLAIGDKVFCPFTTNCNHCYFCDQGLTARCQSSQLFGWVENGIGLHGGQAEYARVPLADSTLMKIPDGLPPEDGLLLGDNFSTAFFCSDMAEIQPNGTYLVLGCGTVGLMTVQAARQLGAEQLYAFDPVDYRAERAGRYGAMAYSSEEKLRDAIQEATKGRGADAVLEVVGNLPAQRLAMDLLRPGGILSVAGVHTAPQFSFSPVEAFDKNLIYKTGRCSARAYMERLVPEVIEKKLDLGKQFITHRLPLEKAAEAYRIFDQKEQDCIKLVFTDR